MSQKKGVPKFLMLNGSPDRETAGLKASDYVIAITAALNRTHGRYAQVGVGGVGV